MRSSQRDGIHQRRLLSRVVVDGAGLFEPRAGPAEDTDTGDDPESGWIGHGCRDPKGANEIRWPVSLSTHRPLRVAWVRPLFWWEPLA